MANIERDGGKVIVKAVMNIDQMNEDYIDHTKQRSDELARELATDIAYQVDKFGPQRLNFYGWQSVCVEEFGEVAKEYMQGNKEQAIKEAKQAAACFLRLAVEIERELHGVAEKEWMLYTDPI